jgi:inosine-uridine nucleoside N-ribohydrolase
VFELVAVTSNATRHGGNAEAHAAEAERILALTGRTGTMPVVAGADGSFDEIRPSLGEDDHDGHAAVDTIIDAARSDDDLVVIAVGKLTNVALALEKAPDIVPGLRVVWLGSNYPLGGGEYNLDNDPGALTSVLDDGVDAGLDFEIVTVRPGDPTGTAAVQLTLDEAAERMPGLGPTVDPPIVGRTGRKHSTFGDYSAELFRASEPFGDPPRRSLFDLAGVSIVGEPGWARSVEVAAPSFLDGEFVERPNRDRTILYWEQFDSEAILGDFFTTLETAGSGS